MSAQRALQSRMAWIWTDLTVPEGHLRDNKQQGARKHQTRLHRNQTRNPTSRQISRNSTLRHPNKTTEATKGDKHGEDTKKVRGEKRKH